MVLWINGAFGSGKTSVAFELHRRLAHSHVYDPENIGYFLWKNEPKSIQKPNFQDEPLWRRMNAEMLLHIASRYDGTIIAPMTVCSAQYYDEIIGELRRAGIDVRHFLLGAERETLLKRLASRMDGGDSWAARQIDACLAGFLSPVFENQLRTDTMSVGEVVERIAQLAGLTLSEDTRGALRKWIDRKRVQAGHIRF